MIDILKEFPEVYEEFFAWIYENYRGTEWGYANADWNRQATTLKAWLGYDQEPFDCDEKQAAEYLRKITTEYYQLLLKYPDPKSMDPFRVFIKMTLAEQKEKYPELFNRQGEPTILPSLKDAFDFNKIPVELRTKQEHTDFWNNVIVNDESPF